MSTITDQLTCADKHRLSAAACVNHYRSSSSLCKPLPVIKQPVSTTTSHQAACVNHYRSSSSLWSTTTSHQASLWSTTTSHQASCGQPLPVIKQPVSTTTGHQAAWCQPLPVIKPACVKPLPVIRAACVNHYRSSSSLVSTTTGHQAACVNTPHVTK